MEETITGIITSLGFSSIESFMALLVVGLAVIGALIVVITFRPLMEYYPYTYPNSRVRAKIGKIFNDKQLTEFFVRARQRFLFCCTTKKNAIRRWKLLCGSGFLSFHIEMPCVDRFEVR